MEAEEIFETLAFISTLTRLIVREDFSTCILHESFKSYIKETVIPISVMFSFAEFYLQVIVILPCDSEIKLFAAFQIFLMLYQTETASLRTRILDTLTHKPMI
jgi:hypothetical protein